MVLNPWSDITPETKELITNFEQVLEYKINITTTITKNIESTLNVPEYNFEDYALSPNLYKDLLMIDNIKITVNELLNVLQESVRIRVQTTINKCKNCLKTDVKCTHCRVGVLFSGGLDCTILALLSDKYIDKNIPIDLLNVAFEKVHKDDNTWNVPDRLTGLESYEELQRLCPQRMWNFVQINVSRCELKHELENRICHLVYPLQSVLDESLGAALWFASRGQGRLKHSDEVYNSPCRVSIYLQNIKE